MKGHIQVVAILHICMAALALLVAVIIALVMGGAGVVVHAQGGENAEAGLPLVVIAVLIGGVVAVFSLPGLLGGWALYTGRPWGRVVVMVLSILHLLSFPIGTALGVYSLWVLLQPEASTPPLPTAQRIG